jgi:hypothetical protein
LPSNSRFEKRPIQDSLDERRRLIQVETAIERA